MNLDVDEPPPDVRERVLVAVLLAIFAALSLGAARETGATADERLLWRCGARVVDGDWSVIETCVQGPLGLYPNQLFAPTHEEPYPAPPASFGPGDLPRARLGMLGFGLLGALLVRRVARRAFGPAGGLLALTAFALQPLMWGYASLVAVDMAHAALTLLALTAVLGFGRRPTPARAAWAGAACAGALATKYLAVLVLPAAVGFVAWFALRGAREQRSRDEPASPPRAVAVAVGLFAAAFLVALHACYGFRAGAGFDAAPSSDTFARLLSVPGGSALLTLFPTPLLRGLDYQLNMGANVVTTYFGGAYAAGHPLYHVAGIATKTPLVVLLAGVLALVLGVPRWLARSGPRARRDTVIVLAGAAVVPFVYLSFFATLQVGIRYVLPLLPLGCVLVGGAAATPVLARLSSAGRRVLCAAFVVGCAGASATAWPNGVGYFNLAVPEERAHELFIDSNADWGQWRDLGRAAVLERRPRAVDLGRAGGPRLGEVAVYVRFRHPPDPEAPHHERHARPARHWLDPFEPVDHAEAAWLVYDVTAEGWRDAAARDPRARAELAIALLGAGRLAEAEAEIALLPPERAAAPTALLDRIRAAQAAPGAPGPAIALANAWIAAEVCEAALDVLDGVSAADQPSAIRADLAIARANAHVKRADFHAAIGALESLDAPPGTQPAAALLRAELYRRTLRLDDGIALLEREARQTPPAQRPPLTELLERLRTDRSRWSTFLQSP